MNFWLELEELAVEAVKAVVPAIAGAYLNKTAGVPGAPAITAGNIGRIAGAVASATIITHMAQAQTPAADPAAAAPAPGPVAVAIAGTPAAAPGGAAAAAA